MSSGDVLDSVASGVTGVGVSGSAEADSNGAGVEPMSAEAAVSDVDRVLNGLFASDDDDDDGDDVDDGNDADGSRVTLLSLLLFLNFPPKIFLNLLMIAKVFFVMFLI